MSDFKINGEPWNECNRVPYEDRIKPKGIFLWLDDIRPMPAHYTHWAKTARQAIEILQTGEVIECSLDHDLGNQVETGYDVAKYIEEQAHNKTLPRIRCKIHSQNPAAQET